MPIISQTKVRRTLARRSAVVAGVLAAGTLGLAAPSFADPISCTTAPTTSGTYAVGEVLTGHETFLGGPASAVYWYWYRIDFAPSGSSYYTLLQDGDNPATNSQNYTLTEADYGHQVEVDVIADSADGYQTDYCDGTAALSPVVGRIGVPVTGSPAASGKAKVGKRLTASVGGVRPGTSVAYQWFRSTRVKKHHRTVTKPIAGATGATYKLKNKDRGNRVSVEVIYNKPGYVQTLLFSGSRVIK